MSRCGCDSGCQCIVNEGTNVTITGDGSVEHPYVISAAGGGGGGTSLASFTLGFTGADGNVGVVETAGTALATSSTAFFLDDATVTLNLGPIGISAGDAFVPSARVDVMSGTWKVDWSLFVASADGNNKLLASDNLAATISGLGPLALPAAADWTPLIVGADLSLTNGGSGVEVISAGGGSYWAMFRGYFYRTA